MYAQLIVPLISADIHRAMRFSLTSSGSLFSLRTLTLTLMGGEKKKNYQDRRLYLKIRRYHTM
eukprot:scaffold7198_cov150-Skeletonema_menzelii.AAC.18